MADCINNPPKYIVLPGEGGGVPGPPGPSGPQGPPGIGELPIPADDVSLAGHDPLFTVQEALDQLLYLQIAINSFTASKSVYEIGESITALGFSWGLNKTGIISQKITGVHVESGNELGIAVRNTTVTFSPALDTTSTFTLAVDDGTNVATSNRGVNFYSGIYYGNAVLPTVIDSNFILSLTKNLQANRGFNFTSNAGLDVYVWYAHKTSLGVANFNASGLDGGFEPPVTISFTNSKGYTEDYYVYRSINPQIGVVSIIVT